MKFGFNSAAALFLAGLCAQHVAQAEMVTLSGQFLTLRYDTALLPSGFNNVELIETPLSWDCTEATCAVSGTPTASIVFGTQAGETVSSAALPLDFVFRTSINPLVSLTDPLGNYWGLAAADNGKWTFSVDIAGQQAPKDAQFATAYGQLKNYVRMRSGPTGIEPTWPLDTHFFSGRPDGWSDLAWTTAPTVIGLDDTGMLDWGPGDQGFSLLDDDGMNMTSPIVNTDWKIRSELLGAFYAQPSKTDPRCQSMSCMSFAPGLIDVAGYAFTMPIVATAAVPETGTLYLSALGLSLMAWRMRRGLAAQRG